MDYISILENEYQDNKSVISNFYNMSYSCDCCRNRNYIEVDTTSYCNFDCTNLELSICVTDNIDISPNIFNKFNIKDLDCISIEPYENKIINNNNFVDVQKYNKLSNMYLQVVREKVNILNNIESKNFLKLICLNLKNIETIIDLSFESLLKTKHNMEFLKFCELYVYDIKQCKLKNIYDKLCSICL